MAITTRRPSELISEHNNYWARELVGTIYEGQQINYLTNAYGSYFNVLDNMIENKDLIFEIVDKDYNHLLFPDRKLFLMPTLSSLSRKFEAKETQSSIKAGKSNSGIPHKPQFYYTISASECRQVYPVVENSPVKKKKPVESKLPEFNPPEAYKLKDLIVDDILSKPSGIMTIGDFVALAYHRPDLASNPQIADLINSLNN